nr:unnamed protein product [Digitaria exilis]
MPRAQPDPEPPPPIHRLLELIKSEPEPATALSHLELLVTTRPAYPTPQPLIFHLLRRLATSSPSHLPRLLGILPRMRHRPRFSESVALVVLSAFSRALMPDAALAAFRDLPSLLGCNPGIRSHNALLDAFVRARRFSDADAFFASLSHGAFGRRLAPNLQTYNIILRSLFARGDVDRAVSLFGSLRRRGAAPDRVTYSTLMSGLAKHNQLVSALDLLDEMPSCGVQADTVCYNALLSGCFKNGKFEKAMRVWGQLVRDPGASPNLATYKVMLDGLCKFGRFKEAGEVWSRMVANKHQPDTVTHGILIHGLCRSGDVDGAARVYSEMVKAGLVLDVAVYNSLIKGFCEAGKIGEAWKFWDSAGFSGVRDITTYNIMIKGMFDSGMVNEATELLAQLENDASCSPDKVTFGTVIHGLCENGFANKAFAILEDARTSGKELDVFSYSSMINRFCKDGRTDDAHKISDAVKIYTEMEGNGCSPTIITYNTLIHVNLDSLLKAIVIKE